MIIITVRVCSLPSHAAPVRLHEAQAASPSASPRTESATLDGNWEMSVVAWTQSEDADFEGQGMILCGQACQGGEELPTRPEASERWRGMNVQCDAEVLQRHPTGGALCRV